jgi:uncharacterized protein (TIGR00255 family)
MTLSSMTGFAQSTGAHDGLTWQWEIRSVNGKALDVRARLPQGFEALDVVARNVIASHVKRGNVQIALSIGSMAAQGAVVVNEQVLAQITKLAEDLRKRLGGPPLQAESLLSLRGVLDVTQGVASPETIEAQMAAMQASLAEAVKALVAMRKAEGARLAAILSAQLNRIEQLTIAARDCPARSPDAVRSRLKEQVERLLEASDTFEPTRLHQEAVLIATRADIQEELDRLFAHIEAARGLAASPEPAGRKFEFLAQEFNREANTLCSKALDTSLTAIGLDLKTVIDQLREQVQNIE